MKHLVLLPNAYVEPEEDEEIDAELLMLGSSRLSICCYKQSKMVIIVHPKSFSHIDDYVEENGNF